jgi:hypothetical protein
LLLIQPLDQAGGKLAQNLVTQYARLLEAEIGVEVERMPPFDLDNMKFRPYAALAVRGAHALALLRAETGLHVGYDEKSLLTLLQVRVLPLAGGADLAQALQQFAPAVPDLADLPPVLRFYAHNGGALDFRAGLLATGQALHDGALRTFALAGLPLPPELPVST